ncbi:MAG: hypothetical protein KIH64_014960 [Mycobacterium sp.]|nr:hypothetical protein [Mycobacterium sp.]
MPQDRLTLHIEPWSWSLEQVDEGLLLTVLCGTVGIYEKAVLLEPDEVAAWEQCGPAGLEPLAEAIRYDSTDPRFTARSRPDLIAGADDERSG